ncbi:MAG: Crp/Fnr family transcriptional regulator [Chloroflexi bacterium]|nr:Crp/Fnr family transcriptional regulator [Chloroflexota bacterium]
MPTMLDVLRSIPYFAELSGQDLDRVRAFSVERSYERGDVVFLEGGPCEGLHVVESGRVRIFKTSAEGKEQVLMIAGPGQTFNEVPVFDGGPNPASAEAIDLSVLLLLPKERLLTLVRENPTLALTVTKVFAGRLRHLTRLVEDLSFRHVIGRVCKILLEHAPQEGPAGQVGPRLTQQEMAAMAGTAREIVSRALRSLEREGIVRLERGRIVILNRKALESKL